MSVVSLRRGPPQASPRSDAELIAAVQAGDREAFDAIYQRHVELVWRRMRRLVGPHADCEDLVQQVFVGTYRALPRFRGDSQLATLLYRITVRVAYDHLRRRRRDAARTVHVEELEQIVARGPGPDAQLLDRETLARALTFLARIKPKKRIAWVLRVVEGLSLDEIGALVDASAAAVGQRVKHAQRELAELLEREVVR